MTGYKNAALWTVLASLFASVFAAPAYATDVEPGDYVALSPGTNLALLYGTFTDMDELQVPGVGMVDKDTHLESTIALARFVHFMKVGPFIVDPQIIVPFGRISSGKAAGERLEHTSGIGDITPFATIWFVHHDDAAHGTYVGFSPMVSIPTGAYNHAKASNIGTNRFTYDMQLGVVQGIVKGVALEAYGDVIWYGHNDNAGVDHQTLTQSSTQELQLWSRFSLTPKTSVAVGYAGNWGGRQYLEQAFNGTKTENQQVRFAVQTMIAPGLELEGSAGRMVHVEGGFREALRTQIRIAKAF
jgi:hypothetical protein